MKQIDSGSEWFVVVDEDGNAVQKFGGGPLVIPDNWDHLEVEVGELSDYETDDNKWDSFVSDQY